MYCPICQQPLPPDSQSCEHCGGVLFAVNGSTNGNGHHDPERQALVNAVQALLVGQNCGRCGYASCALTAEAIVAGEARADVCVNATPQAKARIRQLVSAPKPDPLHVLWGWLTSVRLAIGLIIALALVSVVGTLVPQGASAEMYVGKFGPQMTQWLQLFQVDRLFQSWYFLALLSALGLNTLCCTIKRSSASWRLLARPMADQSGVGIGQMEQHWSFSLNRGTAFQALERVKGFFEQHRFHIQGHHPHPNPLPSREREEVFTPSPLAGEGQPEVARDEGEKGIKAYRRRFGRLGVDILHVSLIIVLGGALLGAITSTEGFQVAHIGESFQSLQGDFSVRVENLWSESYSGTGAVKDWFTTLTVVEDGKDVLTQTIEVNEPLTYKGVSFYQSSFGSDWWDRGTFTVRLSSREGMDLGSIEMGMNGSVYLPPVQLELSALTFMTDFAVDENWRSYNRSQRLNNPALYLELKALDGTTQYAWAFARADMRQFYQGHLGAEQPLQFELAGMVAEQFTGIKMAYNPALPLIYAGFLFMGIGLFLNFYWAPCWAWVVVEGDRLHVGCHGQGAQGREADLQSLALQFQALTAQPTPAPTKEMAYVAG